MPGTTTTCGLRVVHADALRLAREPHQIHVLALPEIRGQLLPLLAGDQHPLDLDVAPGEPVVRGDVLCGCSRAAHSGAIMPERRSQPARSVISLHTASIAGCRAVVLRQTAPTCRTGAGFANGNTTTPRASP